MRYKIFGMRSVQIFWVSDHQPTYELDIEVYPDGDMASKNYKSYIGIPVVNE